MPDPDLAQVTKMKQGNLSDFQRLAKLLRSQKTALEKDDSNRLGALIPLIEEYSGRVIRHHCAVLESSAGGHSEQAAALIREVRQLAGENQQAYQLRKERLNEMKAQLQSASRYLRQVRRTSRYARSRSQWTG